MNLSFCFPDSNACRTWLKSCAPPAVANHPVYGAVEVLGANWLQEIVDRAGFESLDCVTVVGCGHNHLCPDVHLTENLETIPVFQLHIHKYYVHSALLRPPAVHPGSVFRRMFPQPIHRACDRAGASDHLHLRITALQSSGKGALRHNLVFNYKHSHILI